MLAVSPGIVVADYARLLEDMRALVRHELHHHALAVPAPTSPAPDELLSIREAAELLGVTVQTIHEWKRTGRLGFHKLGSRSYLKRAELLAALEPQQRTHKPGKGAVTPTRKQKGIGRG